MWGIVREIGAEFGWSKAWSDAPSEAWHIVYKPGVWKGHSAPAEPPAQVAVAQQLLRAAGATHLAVDGRLDAPTVAAVRELQQRHGLAVDGVPGPRTIAELRRLVAQEERDEAGRTGQRRRAPVPPPHRERPPEPEPAPPSHHRPPHRPHLPHRPGHATTAPTGTTSSPAFPLNRVVAFLGPYLALASGVAAAWLGRHFPGLKLNVDSTTTAITQAAEFIVGAGITWALHHKYLDGWQRWEAAVVAAEREA
jgi:pyruvate/2-oxoglutarate dehydrogenase complex dihydrolipoamide acyltransferase (E2) component